MRTKFQILYTYTFPFIEQMDYIPMIRLKESITQFQTF